MNNRRSTIIFWLTTLVLTVAGVAVVYAVKARPRTVPWDECSEVYRQYAHADGIEATFVHDYRIGDTLTVDVTILQATDSAGWDTIYNNFHLTLYQSGVDPNTIRSSTDAVEVFLQQANNDIVCASHPNRYLAIFHIEDSTARMAILDALMDFMFNTIKTSKKIKKDETNN